jgi:hypothetical protein
MCGKFSPPRRVMTRQMILAIQPGRVSALRNGTSQSEQYSDAATYFALVCRSNSQQTSQVTRRQVIFSLVLQVMRFLHKCCSIGYISDPSQKVRGMSPLHDSGTGSSLGSYGNFEVMPLLCPGGFDTCTTTLAARERYRMNDTDGALSCCCMVALGTEQALQTLTQGTSR